MDNITFLSFLLFSMCHSIHVAVNTFNWLNCSFFTLILYQNEQQTYSDKISSPPKSPTTLFFAGIRFIPKFESGYPERWRFMRLECVRTGDFRGGSNESGVVEIGNFRCFRSLYLPTFYTQGHNIIILSYM